MEPPADLKSRPVIAGPAAPTQNASKLVEKILTPLVTTQSTYIKDDWEFIGKLPQKIPFECKLFGCDIESLYTSINTDLGIQAVEYWVKKRRDLIPARFTLEFILQLVKFVFTNNNFRHKEKMFHQNYGASMGGSGSPPYACLSVGFLEETKLFPVILPNHFETNICDSIKEFLSRYIDDGFVPLPAAVNEKVFLNCLNLMHPDVKFTLEPAEFDTITKTETITFLDIKIIKHEDNTVETEIFYKSTNSHHYLHYKSQHPKHILENIPFNLAKKIIVFTTKAEKVKNHLKDLKRHLLNCEFPESLVDRGIHRAKIQGPAPDKSKQKIIPFVTTNYNNLDFTQFVGMCNSLLKDCKDDNLKQVFENSRVILGLRQPNSLKQILMPTSIRVKPKNGLFKCHRSNCEICKTYLQEVTSFVCSNGTRWVIKCNITCHSKYVLYYLKCNMCDVTTYTGRTNNLRLRTNNHISSCANGTGTDIFDIHVYNCGVKDGNLHKPYFKLYAFMEFNSEQKLILYEKMLHKKKLDTMNS